MFPFINEQNIFDHLLSFSPYESEVVTNLGPGVKTVTQVRILGRFEPSVRAPPSNAIKDFDRLVFEFAIPGIYKICPSTGIGPARNSGLI